jgi:hypothetical protein
VTQLDATNANETELITAALDLLDKGLNKVYLRTSSKSSKLVHQLVEELDNPLDDSPDPYDFRQVLTPELEKWRNRSIACITEAYLHLLDAVKSADKAEKRVWRAVDRFFHWSATNKRRSKRLTEWLCRCGVESLEGQIIDRTWFAFDDLDIKPLTRSSGGLLESLIIKDYRKLIVHTIAELRDRAILSPSRQRIPEAAVPANDGRPEPHTGPPDRKHNGLAADEPRRIAKTKAAANTGDTDRRAAVNAFIWNVWKATGRKIFYKNISTVAGYTARSEIERYMSYSKRATYTAIRKFNHVLSMTPEEFIRELDRKKPPR